MTTDRPETAPPVRLAASPDHPWFHPWWSRHARVTVDGIALSRVHLVDTEEGWAEITRDPLERAGDRWVTVRVRAALKIEALEASGNEH